MAKSEFQRLKVHLVFETLRLESDEDNRLSTNDVIEVIKDKYKIEFDRKAVYNAVELINNFYQSRFGNTIIDVKVGNPNYYFYKPRDFGAHEIKFLVDAIQSASFIPKRETKMLCNKIAPLAGMQQADLLMSNTVCLDKTKHSNAEVFVILNKINSAIKKKKKLLFKYFYLGLKLEREYRNGGKSYEMNPVGTVFVNGYYYLECYNNNDDKQLLSFRVDRMCDCVISEKDITPSPIAKEFTNGSAKDRLTAFGMWSGEAQDIILITIKKNLGDIYDKFGENIKIDDLGDGKVRVVVNVNLSPVFYGWIASYGDEMKIVSPQSVKNEFLELMHKAIEQYK